MSFISKFCEIAVKTNDAVEGAVGGNALKKRGLKRAPDGKGHLLRVFSQSASGAAGVGVALLLMPVAGPFVAVPALAATVAAINMSGWSAEAAYIIHKDKKAKKQNQPKLGL